MSDRSDRPINRREFLTSATLAAAAAGTASSSLPAAETAPSGKRRIRIGFLGASHSHALSKLRVVLASPEYDLVGVCEPSPAVAQECEQLGATMISQADLLVRSEVVAVESAVRNHARHALLALRGGKHVHLEKPPGVALGELRQMIALAREQKRWLQVGYMWRHHPGFAAILEAARNGWLGEIFLVRAAISNHLAPARRPEWAEFKGGSLFELGSHLVDVIVRLLGRPRAVTPILRRHGKFEDHLNDNNAVVLEYGNALAVLTNTALQEVKLAQRSFEVLGANGTAVLCPLEPPGLEIELVKAAGPYPRGVQAVSLPAYARYEADFAVLARAVRGEEPLLVPLEVELEVQETLLRVCEML